MRNFIITTFLLLLGMSNSNAQLAGDWKGSLIATGNTTEFIFHIVEKDSEYSGTMDIPAQGAIGIPLTTVILENKELTLTISQVGISFTGKVAAEQIEGSLKQGEQEFPLILTKANMQKPGDTSLVTSEVDLQHLIAAAEGDYPYEVEDYFARPKSSNFQLSPNGKYLSYMEKDEANKRHVMIKDIASGEVERAIAEKEELIRGYGWINDSRLVYIMDKGGDENYHLYAVNIDGTENIDLTPYEGVKASILTLLKEQKEYIVIALNKDNPQVFEPYKIHVTTGALEKLYTNDDPSNPIVDYDFDKDGNLRGFSKMFQGIQTQYYYKVADAAKYELLHTIKWDDTFTILSFNYASTNPDEAYVLTNLAADKARIVLYDFKAKKQIKEVYAHDSYDVSILSLSRKRQWEIDYLGFEGEKVTLSPVSATFKTIFADLTKAFPSHEYTIAGKTDDESQYLIVVQSDKLYGRYYLYDAKARETTLLYDLMPQLKEEDMAEMRPIKFKSRDGLTLHGYLTIPKSTVEGQRFPLIVNPHGGPQGVRDSWGFNPEAQLFASRGYATLQVNFRISGGYGKAFLRAGFKQVGRKAMDDVEDAVHYSIAAGIADSANIAIYGGSHGGYATLMGLIKTPDLYKAGVDYVGVSNIFTFFESFPEYWKPYRDMVKEIWYDIDDPEEALIAKEVSPVFHLDKIKAPLFVVQGANDPRVKIAESDQIVSALRKKGVDVPYMVKYDEGHGFAKEENRIFFYKAMVGFFKSHLK